MDLSDDEWVKCFEMNDANKLLEKCKKNEYSVTFYGDDKKIVEEALRLHKEKELIEKALRCYYACLKQKQLLKTNTNVDSEPEYWEKERYHLKRLEGAIEGEVVGL